MKPTCRVYKLGNIPYQEAWNKQTQLAEAIVASRHPPTLLLLEHPHTYTFGRRGNEKNLLWDEHELMKRGISVYWVDRGGDVTYHGPGQLVGYPLIPLSMVDARQKNGEQISKQLDILGYLRKIELTIIAALTSLGISSFQIEGITGVWVDPMPALNKINLTPKKIASIGVKIDAQGLTRHGFSLNVNPDMSYWQGIVACGLDNYQMTSLAEIHSPVPSIPQVTEALIQAFGKVFNYQMLEEPAHLLEDFLYDATVQ